MLVELHSESTNSLIELVVAGAELLGEIRQQDPVSESIA
jgi:hypothetical protein